MRARLTYRTCALAGLAAGSATSLAVAGAQHLSIAVQAAVVLVGVAAFLALTFATKLLSGREVLILYHHSLAVLAACLLVTLAARAPVLAHLDATAIGLAVLLAIGRVGCLRAGCCHGRPARRGPVYTADQVAPYLAGTPLAPVPLAESAALLALAAGGLAAGGPDGTALVLFLGGYAVARFALELRRGDLRPYRHGLSEAQWTALAVATALAAAGLAGVVPGGAWAALPAGLLAVAAVGAARLAPGLLEPRHLVELTRASAPAQRVVRTSLGILVSEGAVGDRAHFAVSAHGRSLDAAQAAALGRVLLTRDGSDRDGELVQGAAGVWHVIASSSPATPTPRQGLQERGHIPDR